MRLGKGKVENMEGVISDMLLDYACENSKLPKVELLNLRRHSITCHSCKGWNNLLKAMSIPYTDR